MTAYIVLLRAVNVGGTGKLPMSDLKAMCEKTGFGNVRKYIASGNVVFDSQETEGQVKATMEAALTAYAGKSVGVLCERRPNLPRFLPTTYFQTPLQIEQCAYFWIILQPAIPWSESPGRMAKRFGSENGRSRFITTTGWPIPS